jgi:hypothetical protein
MSSAQLGSPGASARHGLDHLSRRHRGLRPLRDRHQGQEHGRESAPAGRITSESTEEYDRGEKLENYQRIPSLDTIVLVSHREQLLEVFERQHDGSWRRSEARKGASLSIDALDATLSVDEIYAAATPR